MNKRIERLMQNLPEDIDAALITGYDIRRYYTRQAIPDSFLLVSRTAVWLFASPFYRDKARKVKDAIYVEGKCLLSRLTELLIKERDSIKRVAVQADQMTVAEYEQLKRGNIQ